MVVGLLANKDASSSSSNSPSSQKSNYDFASAYQATYGHITPISSVNAKQTFHRQVNTSKGIVFAEDLPKLDYVSTSLRKQILEVVLLVIKTIHYEEVISSSDEYVPTKSDVSNSDSSSCINVSEEFSDGFEVVKSRKRRRCKKINDYSRHMDSKLSMDSKDVIYALNSKIATMTRAVRTKRSPEAQLEDQ
ncbi:unnamed protein product [Mytilus edulis]|uniref:Uncharacterized protein n=1 Tax=Mytilus edulis TaxID=6550 RepID=A0A8S3S3G2_MYTED|nr:unnamed protein product [Mytilus edulis]